MPTDVKAIILAAGSGRRLGHQLPKAHVEVSPGICILDHQLANLATQNSAIASTLIVVGYKKELFDRYQRAGIEFAANDEFATTNTAKSLLLALRTLRPNLRKGESVLWLNGDVVFDPAILAAVAADPGRNLIAVDRKKTGEEEVKYTLDEQGRIRELSKSVQNALGEAVGINRVRESDVDLLIECLDSCAEMDYFEKGVEQTVLRGAAWYPMDIGDHFCVEVDFAEDLERARGYLSTGTVR